MALSYNKFFEILNHTRAKESAITLEESIDKKLNEFTNYSNEKKTQILKSQNGNIILVNDTTTNIENLNHFKHSDDIDYIRNKIYSDYSQAGWQVSWDEKFYPDGSAYYVLKIAR